jgi:hypothetical protein
MPRFGISVIMFVVVAGRGQHGPGQLDGQRQGGTAQADDDR